MDADLCPPDLRLNGGYVLGEAFVRITERESQLAWMAHDQERHRGGGGEREGGRGETEGGRGETEVRACSPVLKASVKSQPVLCCRTHLAVDRLYLLQRGQHEHGCLPHARLGLAEDVHAQDGLGDALVLHWREEGRGSHSQAAALEGRGSHSQTAAHVTCAALEGRGSHSQAATHVTSAALEGDVEGIPHNRTIVVKATIMVQNDGLVFGS